MPTKQRVVTLTHRERQALEDFVSHGKKSARAITRARILLLMDEGRNEHELTELLGGVAWDGVQRPQEISAERPRRHS